MNDSYKEAIRHQRALERLGTSEPFCVRCTENDWRCLELHHIEGAVYGKTYAILCRNCHRKVSDAQRSHPDRLTKTDPCTLETIGHFLLGLAELLNILIDTMRAHGRRLIAAAQVSPPPYGLSEGVNS